MAAERITTIEAGRILGRDASTIRHMIRRGKLGLVTKAGRDNRILRSVVERIRAEREEKRNGKA